MQFQVIDKTGRVIAWLDSENDEQLVHGDYMLRTSKSTEQLETVLDEEDNNFYAVFRYSIII